MAVCIRDDYAGRDRGCQDAFLPQRVEYTKEEHEILYFDDCEILRYTLFLFLSPHLGVRDEP